MESLPSLLFSDSSSACSSKGGVSPWAYCDCPMDADAFERVVTETLPVLEVRRHNNGACIHALYEHVQALKW